MRIPYFLFFLKRHIPLSSLYIIIIVKFLIRHFCTFVVELLYTRKHIFVERTLAIGKGITAERTSLEVHLYLFQQSVGRGEVAVAGVVGLEVFFLTALECYHGMGLLSAVTCMYFLEIDGFCHEPPSDRLVCGLIDVLDVVAMSLLHTF